MTRILLVEDDEKVRASLLFQLRAPRLQSLICSVSQHGNQKNPTR